MLQSARVNWTSTSRQLLLSALQAALASWQAKTRERMTTLGTGGYIVIWVALPVFELAMAGLIYRGVRPELLRYSVVGVAASTFIYNAQYYIGEILDGERINGTLVGLFLAPCPRLSWLTGFAVGGLLETVLAAAATVLFGAWAFGVRFAPDYPALVVTLVLFLLSLWGMGFIFSAMGLVLKRSNDLSNLLSPFLILLGGVFYPVSLLPRWLQLPARCLPLGYGMQAMAAAALHHAGIADLAPQLLPLTGFALALPVLGVLAFRWMERGVRRRGELDLY